ncbi:MAG: hypothetical protein H7Y01_10160 [Ferruginibacter sp.]|nr:hypothetical protein [Chitinophagaceae bacterium]
MEIGGKLISELADWKSYGPGIGLQTIFNITKHSGLETGLYFKINPKYYRYIDGAGIFSGKNFPEKVVQVPLLYRFDSKPINFTAGLALDYILNLEKMKKSSPFGLSPDYFHRLELVSTISVSKSFYLNKSLVIEPELRASAFVPQGGGGVALNVSLRKMIF